MIREIKSGSSGSATLEITIIFPVMMLVFFSLVFFSTHLYQKVMALEAATYTVTQAAAIWDNTNKEFEDGFLPAWNNDGLYWRLLNDRPGSRLVIEKSAYARNFLDDRLKQGTFRPVVPSEPESDVTYANSFTRRTVRAGVRSSLFSPVSPFLRPMAGEKMEALAEADVAEPVEFIRNCDLGGEYLKRVADYLGIFGKEKENQSGIVLIGSTYSYAGGDAEKLYHYPGCPYIGRIKDQREFHSVSEAKAAGYHLCIKCAENRRKQLESQMGGPGAGRQWLNKE